MALAADRRPISNLPVGATPTSPSFNPKTLNLTGKNSTQSQSQSQSTQDKIESSDSDDYHDDNQLLSSRSVSPDSILDHQNLQQITRDSTPPTSTSSPPSSSSTQQTNNNSSRIEPPITASTASVLKKVKKSKPVSRAPIATGISTAIPVTGEKPKPVQKGDASLEDDVLYAIFVILYEKDPKGEGMTVKQICDVLSELHPEMANLSTKTSNLVSAKLNAYVKRVEKGDTSLNYAISRDWADASPKRMVYVYRGILAPGFEVVAKKLMDELKQQRGEEEQNQSLNQDDPLSNIKSEEPDSPKSKNSNYSNSTTTNQLSSSIDFNYNDESLEAGKQATLSKPRRQTMFDLGITKNTFNDISSTGFDKINLFVPYSSAPVTASLTELTINEKDSTTTTNNSNSMDFDEEFEGVFADSEDDEDDYFVESIKKNGKRSKSMSYISLNNKKSKVLTAAAAAPRASRAPSSHSPDAAAAAAALHAAAIRAISRANSFVQPNITNKNSTNSTNKNSSTNTNTPKTLKTGTAGSCSNKKWLNVIRSGFLSQDIGAPEDTSLSDLDKFFS
ncbi:unnamed protein product [Candida verbasci]|uniref:GDS1 winged helix domain-containing protein n=1 Tax=Candida verbasci TaxID=1227364 RepID=A0A9W4TZL4_9ASCO|nr:unnamed protein product [Candida verbasci]